MHDNDITKLPSQPELEFLPVVVLSTPKNLSDFHYSSYFGLPCAATYSNFGLTKSTSWPINPVHNNCMLHHLYLKLLFEQGTDVNTARHTRTCLFGKGPNQGNSLKIDYTNNHCVKEQQTGIKPKVEINLISQLIFYYSTQRQFILK